MSTLQQIKDYFFQKNETVAAKEEINLTPTDKYLEDKYGDVEYALRKGFVVKVISGEPSSAEEKKRLAKLLESYPDNFHFYALPERPKDNYAIIGKKNLYMEVPHEPGAKIVKALGITEAYEWLLKNFNKNFEDSLKEARKITREELVYT